MSHHYSDYDAFKASSQENSRLLEQEGTILSFTEVLAEAMQREGVSKAELAKRLGKTREYVKQILAGRNLRLRTIADLANVLGYRIRFTFEEVE